jgi:hypothetical protein
MLNFEYIIKINCNNIFINIKYISLLKLKLIDMHINYSEEKKYSN